MGDQHTRIMSPITLFLHGTGCRTSHEASSQAPWYISLAQFQDALGRRGTFGYRMELSDIWSPFVFSHSLTFPGKTKALLVIEATTN